jgi:hypothetical protein
MDIAEFQHSGFGHAFPVPAEPPIQAEHGELRRIIESLLNSFVK